MIKEIRKILSNSCLSEDNNGCEYDGCCYEHEKAKIEELIAKHDSELLKAKEEIIKQYKWERDLTISQLESVGAGLGLNMVLWLKEHDNVLLDKFVVRLEDYFVIPHDVYVIEKMAEEMKAEVKQ